MRVKIFYQTPMPLYVYIILLTMFSACGLLGSDEDGGLLTVTPVSAVEVVLKVNAQPGADIAITRDGTELFSFTMEGADTLLIDTDLTPNTSYTWQVRRLSGRPQTATRQATTLDTTSQAFTWQKFEFGQNSYSTIKDVAIIDENNIWAVGEIYMNDSTGKPDFRRSNAVHWNGKTWTVKRVPYIYQNEPFYNQIEAVFAFNDDNIWFGGNGVIHWDGRKYIPKELPQNVWGSNRINKIWGTSGNDLYIVGNNGSIAHYNGSEWMKLESGTSLNINDIWGSKNSLTGKWEILAVAYSSFTSNSKYLLKIQKEETQSLPIEGLGPGMHTVWFEAGRRYFVGGNDLYQTFEPEKGWTINEQFEPGFVGSKVAVRGSGLNDIIVVGTYGLVMHFNGANWHLYEDQLLLPAGSGSYTSVAVSGDIVVSGGAHNSKGIVLIGRRE